MFNIKDWKPIISTGIKTKVNGCIVSTTLTPSNANDKIPREFETTIIESGSGAGNTVFGNSLPDVNIGHLMACMKAGVYRSSHIGGFAPCAFPWFRYNDGLAFFGKDEEGPVVLERAESGIFKVSWIDRYCKEKLVICNDDPVYLAYKAQREEVGNINFAELRDNKASPMQIHPHSSPSLRIRASGDIDIYIRQSETEPSYVGVTEDLEYGTTDEKDFLDIDSALEWFYYELINVITFDATGKGSLSPDVQGETLVYSGDRSMFAAKVNTEISPLDVLIPYLHIENNRSVKNRLKIRPRALGNETLLEKNVFFNEIAQEHHKNIICESIATGMDSTYLFAEKGWI